MLLKQLSDDDRKTILRVGELLISCDKPLRWNGKLRGESSQNSASGKVTFKRGQRGAEALDELSSTFLDKTESVFGDIFGGPTSRGNIETTLAKRIEKFPLYSEDDPAIRARTAVELLREILKDNTAAKPAVPKLMLFELFLLALADEGISNVQWQVLNEFKHHFHLEDHLFEDLLERAQCTHREAQKTIAIILE
jgi:hypothetical protein